MPIRSAPETKAAKNRLHLDYKAPDPAAVIERLVGLGASKLSDQAEVRAPVDDPGRPRRQRVLRLHAPLIP